MVMVPQQASGLAVRKVVILILAGVGNVLSPTVKWSTRVGTVQVDRILHLGIVNKANNCLSASGDDEGRSGRHAVVANKCSSTKVRVNLLGVGFNFHLIIPNILAGNRVWDFPARCQ